MSTGWIHSAATQIAARAEAGLRDMVAISSPSGDAAGAEGCLALATSLAPERARSQRIPCSSPGNADDLLLTLGGTGTGRILLLGHVDTVVAHAEHRPMEERDGQWVGSGTVDMKGGDILALGVLGALEQFSAEFAEVALLLVCDEEWRQVPFAHARRFSGWDACLCFEAGERTPDGGHAVIVRRKAAGTVRVTGHGRASHAGAAPDKGRNALVALAGAAQHVAGLHDPEGPDRLTAVPTILRSGEALNVVPAAGELTCDLRADSLAAIEGAIASIPTELAGVELRAQALRLWPGMQATDATAPVLAAASQLLGEPVMAHGRGGASDASHIATTVSCTIDGLGPRGGNAHHPDEFLLIESMRPRAAVALAVAAAAPGHPSVILDTPPTPIAASTPFAITRATVSPRRAYFDAAPVRVRVRFRSAAATTIRIQITSAGGRIARRFDVHRATAPGIVQVRWNGLTTNGFAARDGRYRVRAGQAGGRLRTIATVVLRGHVYPVRGAHGFRGPIGTFGAPRNGGRRHDGFDINAACGTPVVAARGGTVTTKRYDPVLYGNLVIVHGSHERRDYWYAHLRVPASVKRGEHVRTGQRIGVVGATGNARTVGCHLHFEEHGPGGPFDPLPFLALWDGWS